MLRLATERARDGEDIAVSGYPVAEPVLITTTGTVASAWGFDLTQLPDLAGPVLADLDDLYLVDATINPGNSGGPVYRTRDGALIGVCLSIRMAQTQLEQLDRAAVPERPGHRHPRQVRAASDRAGRAAGMSPAHAGNARPMTDIEGAPGLSAEELAEHGGHPLPPREQMSLITPGAVGGTPAMEVLPDEAQTWHGNPDDVHIM